MKKILATLAAFTLAMLLFALGLVLGTKRAEPFASWETALESLIVPFDPKSDPHYVEMSALFEREPPSRIVMLGDSLTEYGHWSELLKQPVTNRGIAGDTSTGVLLRLQNSTKGAKLVFLLVGINDTAHDISEAQTRANIEAIVGELGKTSKVVLQSLILTRKAADLNAYVLRMNAFEQSLCARTKCRYVDVNPALSEAGHLRDDFAVDGLHLNESGYAAWAAILKPILELELKSAS